MTQQINTLKWEEPGVQGIAIEGGLSGLGGKVMMVKSGGDGLELSGEIYGTSLGAGERLTVQGAGPFNSLAVDGTTFNSQVPSGFTDGVTVYNGLTVDPLITTPALNAVDVEVSGSVVVGSNAIVLNSDGTGTVSSDFTITGVLTASDSFDAAGGTIQANTGAGGRIAFFQGVPTGKQTITYASMDPAITELQDILIAYTLATDGR